MRKSKVIDIREFKKIDPDKTTIEIIKSDKYLEEVKSMSDFINDLEMSEEQRGKLIVRLVEYDKNVRIDAFVQTLMKNIRIEKI